MQPQNSKRRCRDETERELRDAISRLTKRNENISISAIAREAGVSPGLLHNRYPSIVIEIRRLLGVSKRCELSQLRELILELQSKSKALRLEVNQLKKDNAELASENESIRRSTPEIVGGNVSRIPTGMNQGKNQQQ